MASGSADAVVGKWKLVEVEYVGNDEGYDGGFEDEGEGSVMSAKELGLSKAHLTFAEDGSFRGRYWSDEEGRWRAKGGKIVLKMKGRDPVELEIDGGALVRSDHDSEHGRDMRIFYKREVEKGARGGKVAKVAANPAASAKAAKPQRPEKTPLYEAIAADDAAAVRELVASGAHPNELYKSGLRPLHLAVLVGSNKALRALTEGGADVHVQLGKTRAWRGHIKGTPVAIEHLPPYSPLGYAAYFDNRAAVYLLAEAGADVHAMPGGPKDDDPEPILTVAAASDSHGALRALLELGADPNKRNDAGWTPLQRMAGWAHKPEHVEAARILLDAGADPNNDARGRTPVTVARENRAKHAAEMLDLLLSRGGKG